MRPVPAASSVSADAEQEARDWSGVANGVLTALEFGLAVATVAAAVHTAGNSASTNSSASNTNSDEIFCTPGGVMRRCD